MQINLNNMPVPVPQQLRDVTLLDFIRDHVGLKGTKFGCGAGLCGACTVHIDGRAVRACQVLVGEIEGQKITTIEGLADDTGDLHPVQQAWIEGAVPQCGYCQAGQIMAAVSLLSDNSNPTDTEISEHMSGNLCRCGTYSRIHQAIIHAAGEINDANDS